MLLWPPRPGAETGAQTRLGLGSEALASLWGREGFGKGHVSGSDGTEAARAQDRQAPVARTEMAVNLLTGWGEAVYTCEYVNTELILVLLSHSFPHEQL